MSPANNIGIRKVIIKGIDNRTATIHRSKDGKLHYYASDLVQDVRVYKGKTTHITVRKKMLQGRIPLSAEYIEATAYLLHSWLAGSTQPAGSTPEKPVKPTKCLQAIRLFTC